MSNYIYFNDAFEVRHYPSGEFHVIQREDVEIPPWIIAPDVRDFNGLAQVVAADEQLERRGIFPEWFVPFFPFARDDRRDTPAHAFELGLALKMVKDLQITVLDPHSDVAGQLPHITQAAVVEEALDLGLLLRDSLFLIPDAGATKKAESWARPLGLDTLQAYKKRDPTTGRLSGFTVGSGGEVIPSGKPLVMVDDICDGGGTFMGLIDAIEQLWAITPPITLLTTHGLYTNNAIERFHKRGVRLIHAGPSQGLFTRHISYEGLLERAGLFA